MIRHTCRLHRKINRYDDIRGITGQSDTPISRLEINLLIVVVTKNIVTLSNCAKTSNDNVVVYKTTKCEISYPAD